MKKSKETKEILKEWRKFEFKHKKLNEAQSSPVIKRKKPRPSQKAIDLKKELEGEFGKDSFYCYDFFDGHSDEEMINPDGGYQIEIEELIEHVKGMQEFPSDIDLADIVISESDVIHNVQPYVGSPNIVEQGQFDVQIQSGSFKGGSERYGYGEIVINGRNQKIIYKNEHGYTFYYLFPDSDSQQAPRKKFKLRLGGAWN